MQSNMRRLLREVLELDLGENAEELRARLEDAIRGDGIPEDDAMRFYADGDKVPEEIFNKVLDDVIESWPRHTWTRGKNDGWNAETERRI